MKNVYVIAGHEGKGTGARSLAPEHTSSFMDEGEETLILQRYIVYYLKAKHHIEAITDDPRSSLFNVISWLKGRVGVNDIILDVHFNAFAEETAHGTEVLIPTIATQEEKSLGSALLTSMCMAMGTYPRGVFDETRSPHKRLGMLSGPSSAVNVLVEVCFCTNEEDTMKYFRTRQRVGEALADTLAQYAKR